MSKNDISNSVAIPIILNTKPTVPTEASEELANSFRQKYAPLITTMENTDIMVNSSTQMAAVIISEDELTGELPVSYGETRIVIQARDPHLAWIYWEFSTEDRNRLKSELGIFEFAHTELFLRIFNETMNYMFEIKLPEDCNNWYATLNDSNCDYFVQLCAHAPSLGDLVLATSKTAHTPTDRVSENVAKWVAARPVKVIKDISGTLTVVNCDEMQSECNIIETVSVEGAYIGSSEEVQKCLKEGCFSMSSDSIIKTYK